MVTQNPVLKRILRTFTLPLLIALIAALLQGLDSNELLRYQRDQVLAGQWWRLLSGHFIHLGWAHWLMNMLGLLLIHLLFEPFFKKWQVIFYLVLSGVLISLCMLTLSPGVGWYVGLSGALHALFIAGLLAQMRQQPAYAGLILSILLAKLLWEQIYGPLPGSEQTAGGPIVIVAHSYGAITGVMLYLSLWFCRPAARFFNMRKKGQAGNY